MRFTRWERLTARGEGERRRGMREPQPLRYHGPGWTLETKGVEYLLWAPNDKRDHWAACWQETEGGLDGNYVQGETAAEVLRVFPESIAVRFNKVLATIEERR
jgi:hypothetical protein